MKITSSYDVELRGGKGIFTDTIKIYREALAFLIDVFFKEWDTLSSFAEARSTLQHCRKHDPQHKDERSEIRLRLEVL